ncbi:MAG: ATP-binding protein, partial [Clostridia bacterium]|nr:ATP-binding protein [Clostridia bacterium]
MENKKPHIYIRSYNLEFEIVNSNNEIAITKLNSGQIFAQPLSYFSNVFNPSELRDSFTAGDINISSIIQQQIYTPSVIMKRNHEKRRKAYHHYVDNSYNTALYTLADIQMQNMIQSYEDYQAVSFLNCFFNSPDSIKTELPIFDRITIHFRPFAEELVFNPEEERDVQKWLDRFKNPNSIVSENDNSNLLKPYYIPRYILEFSKLAGYQYIVFQKKLDWKLHVLACLFSEVIALLFGPVLDYICELLPQNFDIVNIKFWDDLKEWFEAAEQNNECCEDDARMKYDFIMFNKYYNEAKEILACDTYEDITQGSYRVDDIKEFLRFYRNSYSLYCIWTKYISVEFHPSSSGELAMVNLVSYMYQAFAEPASNNEDILIIIDELDAYLHPRWQQGILSWLLKWWQDDNLFNKYSIQIFFTTHSPILLSDIPGDKVIYLCKNSQQIYLEESNHKTFGADIYTLFYLSRIHIVPCRPTLRSRTRWT